MKLRNVTREASCVSAAELVRLDATQLRHVAEHCPAPQTRNAQQLLVQF